jgi:hypothetical protein
MDWKEPQPKAQSELRMQAAHNFENLLFSGSLYVFVFYPLNRVCYVFVFFYFCLFTYLME